MRLLIISLCFFFVFNVSGQSRFYAKVDAQKILEDSYVRIEFVMENADATNFSPPNFRDFDITGGPSTSSSYSNVNGRATNKKSYTYELSPKKSGKLTIGSASIIAGGKSMKTKPIVIDVIKADKKTTKQQSDISNVFMELEVTDSTVHIGQQVILKYKIYTQININSHKNLNEAEYNGFFVKEMRRPRNNSKREIINGKEYYVFTLEHVALFPQQTGSYTFGPFRYKLGTPTGRRSSGFFSTQELKYFNVSTNKITIQVQDFGETPPRSFSGAVGQYSMQVSNNQKTITSDDAFTIKMQIDGDGDSRTVNAPTQDFGPDLDVYDPNILYDEDKNTGRKFTNTKVFEYIVVPKKTGRFNVVPEFTYYNPDSNKFITLTSQPLNLFVKQGSGSSKIREDEKISKVELDPMIESTSLQSSTNMFFNSVFYWLLFLLAALTCLYILWQKKKQIDEDGVDPALRKSMLAKQIAASRLAKVDQYISSGQIKEAFAEISNSLKEYLSDKYQIDYSELNKESIQTLLKEKGLSDNSLAETNNSLSICEMALYAGEQAGDVNTVRQQIARLIEEVEAL